MTSQHLYKVNTVQLVGESEVPLTNPGPSQCGVTSSGDQTFVETGNWCHSVYFKTEKMITKLHFKPFLTISVSLGCLLKHFLTVHVSPITLHYTDFTNESCHRPNNIPESTPYTDRPILE